MRGARGQASVEYVALVALAALVLGAAAFAVSGTGVGERVVAALRRALCVVTGGGCDPSSTACVVSSRDETSATEVDVGVVRLGTHEVLLREERADGTIALTLMRSGSGGLAAGVGAGLRLGVGGRELVVGTELRAAALARSGTGETYVVRGRRAADALEQRLRLSVLARRPAETIPNPNGSLVLVRPMPHRPAPELTFTERGASFSLDASASAVGARAGVRVGIDDIAGQRVDRRSGRRTFYLRERDEVAASLRLLGPALQATGAATEQYAVTVDRDGRPVDLAVLAATTLSAGVVLPAVARRALGSLGAPAPRPRLLEIEQHLDLHDPANLDAARAFVARVGDRAAAAEALSARLAVTGTLRARTYALGSARRGIGGHLSTGLKLGGSAGTTTATARLLEAAKRDPDGAWSTDPACSGRGRPGVGRGPATDGGPRAEGPRP